MMFQTFVIPITHKYSTIQLRYVYTKISIIVKIEGILKVTGNHVHFKSGNISKTVLHRHRNNRPLTGSDIG